MIVEMKRGATVEKVRSVVERASSLGLKTQLNLGTDKTIIALLGDGTTEAAAKPGVEPIPSACGQPTHAVNGVSLLRAFPGEVVIFHRRQ